MRLIETGTGDEKAAGCQGGKRRAIVHLLENLLYRHGHVNLNGSGPETHLVVAGLIVQFAGHGTRDRACGCGKPGLNGKRAREDYQVLSTHLNFFRLRVSDGLALERSFRPGKFERNQKLIFRLVAVHMKTWHHHYLNGLRYRRAALHADRIYRTDGQLILLRRQAKRQAQQGEQADYWCACLREDSGSR